MKQCAVCKKLGVGPKPYSEFNRSSRNKDGYQYACREHANATCRDWAKKYPEKNRAKGVRFREASPVATRRIAVRAYLKRFYNITPEQYDQLFEQQSGKCCVCPLSLISQTDETREFLGQPPNEVGRVDHDHQCCPGPKSCGKCIRGLLCFDCNVLLGKAKDDTQILLNAVRYLDASRTA